MIRKFISVKVGYYVCPTGGSQSGAAPEDCVFVGGRK